MKGDRGTLVAAVGEMLCCSVDREPFSPPRSAWRVPSSLPRRNLYLARYAV